jgi:hypothetical protein
MKVFPTMGANQICFQSQKKHPQWNTNLAFGKKSFLSSERERELLRNFENEGKMKFGHFSEPRF